MASFFSRGACPPGWLRTKAAQRSGPATLRFDLAADPRTLNPLFLAPDAASVEQQVARLVFEPFIDLDARGRPQAGAARRNSDASERRSFGRRPDDPLPAAPGRPLERRRAGNGRRRALHASRDPRSAQSRSLARRLRPDRSRLRAQMPQTVRLPSAARVGAGRDDVLFVRILCRSSCCRRTSCAAKRRSRARRSTPRRSSATGPYRFVSWRRGEGLRYAANPRYWRGTPAVANARRSHDSRPVDELALAAIGGARLESARAGAACGACAAIRTSGFVTVPTAVVAGLAFNTAHRAARRRARSTGDRDVDRSRRNFAQDHAGLLSGDQHDPAAVLVGVRSVGSPAGIRSGGSRSALRPRRLAARRRRDAPAQRYAAAPRLRAVSRNRDRRARRDRGASRAARARRRRHDQRRSATRSSFSRVPAFLRPATFDLAYVPWTMGADPDDSAVFGCGGAFELHALVRFAGRAPASARP